MTIPPPPALSAKLITCYLSQIVHGPVRTHCPRDVGRGDERRGYDCTLIAAGDVDWIIDRLNKRTAIFGKAFLAISNNPSPDVEPRSHVIIGAASATSKVLGHDPDPDPGRHVSSGVLIPFLRAYREIPYIYRGFTPVDIRGCNPSL